MVNSGYSQSTTQTKPVKEDNKNVQLPLSVTQEKMGEHAPSINDPDYEAKKAEWVKNYPDEYRIYLEKQIKLNTSSNGNPALMNNKPSIKVAEHAPALNDSDYEAKKAEWINKYPDEYNAVINQSATPTKNTGSYSESNKTVKKTTDQKSTVDPNRDATLKK
jgi:hypothetical protein